MAGNEDLDSWWHGLSEQQKTDVIRVLETGEVDEQLNASLSEAGLASPSPGLPDDDDHPLKARH